MRYLVTLSTAAAIAVLSAGALYGGDVKFIANPSVGESSVSADDIKGVFLATKTSLADGSHVEPVLVKGGPVHEAFLKQYVGKTDAALETYYRSLVFTGKASMPKILGAESEVVAYVRVRPVRARSWSPQSPASPRESSAVVTAGGHSPAPAHMAQRAPLDVNRQLTRSHPPS